MGGAVIGSSALIGRIKNDAMVDVGGVISPFNACLISRGSITLPLRLNQQTSSAATIARFGSVRFGAMMACAIDADSDTHNEFVANLRVITSAVSLGHDESLIVHVGTEGARVADLSAALDLTFTSSS